MVEGGRRAACRAVDALLRVRVVRGHPLGDAAGGAVRARGGLAGALRVEAGGGGGAHVGLQVDGAQSAVAQQAAQGGGVGVAEVGNMIHVPGQIPCDQMVFPS